MQRIIVDITPGFRMPTIYFSQGDVGTQFEIDLRSRFGNTLPASPTVTIQATKPSGFGFSVAATSVTNGVAVFTTTAEMTDEAGRFPAELKVVKDSVSLFSANFYMSGEATTHPEGTIDGSAEQIIPALTLLLRQIEEDLDDAEADIETMTQLKTATETAAGNAAASATAAGQSATAAAASKTAAGTAQGAAETAQTAAETAQAGAEAAQARATEIVAGCITIDAETSELIIYE